MSKRLLQSRDLPGDYKLFIFDSGYSGVRYRWLDIELSNPDWIAFAGRVSIDATLDSSKPEAAAASLKSLLKCDGKRLTDDQRDFLASTEAIKLLAWADEVENAEVDPLKSS